ncbi:hypothetical protein AB0425_26590 [Actinosynnema sp. NPDC051121]
MRGLVVTVLAGLALAGCAQRPADTGTVGPVPPVTGTVGVTSAPVTPKKLSPQGLDVLERARRDGAGTVGLTISTDRGKADEVADALRRLGATVEAADTAIGYLRVTAPIDAVAQMTGVEGVGRVDVDEPLSNGDPTP